MYTLAPNLAFPELRSVSVFATQKFHDMTEFWFRFVLKISFSETPRCELAFKSDRHFDQTVALKTYCRLSRAD